MKDKILNFLKTYWSYIIGIIIAIIWITAFLLYQNKEPMPIVEENGDINGLYSINNIMRLQKPYLCIFEKSDQNSKIEGGIFINTKDVYGEFDIKTGTSTAAKNFSSFLLIKDGKAYTWTSLANVGNISKAAKSAIQGKSVVEQAQIIGRNDKIDYKCKLQPKGINESFFAIPDWITFSESKN